MCVIFASWSRLAQADPRDDLTTALVQAREAEDRLSEDELLAMIFLLLIAGHETTVNLIGNGMLALLEHPDQMDRLRNEPELIKPAIEELLRYDSPVQIGSERYAREEVTIAGVTIAPGEMIFAAARLGQPRRAAVRPRRRTGHHAGAESACGVRSGGALLRRCTSGSHGGPDRFQHAALPDARSEAGRAAAETAPATRDGAARAGIAAA